MLAIGYFEYPISNKLHGECQIANVQYKKLSRFTLKILRFGFVYSCVTFKVDTVF